MRIRYSPRAFADREEIFAYLQERSPQAARDIKSFIATRIKNLGDNPRRSRRIKGLDVRAHWLGRYPYIVYYRVVDDELHVLHIRHVARRPWQGE